MSLRQENVLTLAKAAASTTYLAAQGTTATDVTLQAGTKLVAIGTTSEPVVVRYAAGATTGTFDEFVLAGSTAHFVVPEGVTVISIAAIQNTSTVFMTEKTNF